MWEGDLERKREKRRRRFGFIVGLILAFILHVLIFWGPRIGYSPVMERARRVMVARTYSPPPQREEVRRLPGKKKALAQGEKANRTRELKAPEPAKAVEPERVAPKPTNAPEHVTGLRSKDTEESSEQERELQKLMDELAQYQDELSGEESKWDTVALGEGDGGGSQSGGSGDGEGYADEEVELDSLIRVVVNTYPVTDLQLNPPRIPYPDIVKVKKSKFKENICRVYYRLKTDEKGNIVKREIKTPATKEAQERFALFVNRVVEEVDNWPFPAVKADIHVDVYFTIELE
ncbi:MAG: hypothetical protein C0609_03380 [Deltaproteobacteria bacterium]|nr:MAG: hypothetical protein C0609_03380 [Deltaproteobacteria bacterium]